MTTKKNLTKFNEVFLLTQKKNRRNKWIQNFILGSRDNSWEVLNFMEVIKKLESLKPFIKQVLHNQGTILIIMVNRFNFLQKYFHLFINYLPLFETLVLLDSWKLGSLSNYNHIRFINVRQLPSIIFLFSLENSKAILSEALSLRIPVVSLIDTRDHFDYISKYVHFPIPLTNSLSNIYFLLSYLKNIMLDYYKYTNYFVPENYLFDAIFMKKSDYNTKEDHPTYNIKLLIWYINNSSIGQFINRYYNQYNPSFLSKDLKGLEDDYRELNLEKDNFFVSRRSFDDRFLLLDYLKLKESMGVLKKIRKTYKYSFYLLDERYRLAHIKNSTIAKIVQNPDVDSRGFYEFWIEIAKKRVEGVLEQKIKKLQKRKKSFGKDIYSKRNYYQIEMSDEHRSYIESLYRMSEKHNVG